MSRSVAYLGTHKPGWLWVAGERPRLCVSHVSLGQVRTLHRATGPWMLDSGGFSELAAADQPKGAARWRTSAEDYAQAVARYAEEIGGLEWAAPQDWMCEPAMIHGGQVGMVEVAGTGLSVTEHQALTVANFTELRELWPRYSSLPCPFRPVLQGWTLGDYYRCAELYAAAGVDLAAFDRVGLGSVCRRQNSLSIGLIASGLASDGIKLHGFGVKTQGLGLYGEHLASWDSMAWSYDARRNPPLPGHPHKSCANCLEWAAMWLDERHDEAA